MTFTLSTIGTLNAKPWRIEDVYRGGLTFVPAESGAPTTHVQLTLAEAHALANMLMAAVAAAEKMDR